MALTSNESSPRRSAYLESLRRSPMFSGLDEESLDSVLSICDVHQWDKGSYLFREGDPMVGFFLVRRGAVSIQRLAADGSEKVIHVFRANESFAEGALTSGNYPADAVAVEESETLRVAKSGFMRLLKSDNEFALRTILSLSRQLRMLVNDIEDQQSHGALERLGEWLLRRCGGSGTGVDGGGGGNGSVEIDLGMPKLALAGELRMRSETLSRTLAKLRGDGLIAVEGRTIVVKDPAQLARHVGLI